MVFAKLLKIVNKSKGKSLVDQMKEQPELPEPILALVDQLTLTEQVELLAEVTDKLTAEGRTKLFDYLAVRDFPQQLANEVKKNNSSIAVEGIGILAKFPAPQVVESLIQLLAIKNELIRFETTKALIDLQDPQIVPALIKVLDYPKQWLPARVMEVMLAYKEAAVTQLMGIFSEASQEKQILILEMLAVLGQPASETIFMQGLDSENAVLRAAAVKGLGSLANWSNNSTLARIFQDADSVVRLQAVRVFAPRDWALIKDFFWQALTDDDWLVRSAAAEVLQEKGVLTRQLFDLVSRTREHPDLLSEVVQQVKNYLDRS